MKTSTTLLSHARVQDDADFVDFLTHAGYMYAESSGFYSLTTLGTLALSRLECLIDTAMMDAGYGKIMLSLLQKDSLWATTGRAQDYGSELMSVKLQSGAIMRLSATAEEQVTSLARHYLNGRAINHSVYQMGTKWRDELRARSGLVRAREFRMLDLYTFHATTNGMMEQYAMAKTVFHNLLLKLGCNVRWVSADCGEIGGQLSEELQVETSLEDDGWLEVGHCFALGAKYAQAFQFQNQDKTDVHMSCHGIGSTRLLAVLLNRLRQGKSLIGQQEFCVCDDVIVTWSQDQSVVAQAEQLYLNLRRRGRHVIWEDRFARAGQALNASEMLGARHRWVISERTAGSIEHTWLSEGKTDLVRKEGDILDVCADTQNGF